MKHLLGLGGLDVGLQARALLQGALLQAFHLRQARRQVSPCCTRDGCASCHHTV